jgi:hypothetical protein
MWPGLGQVAPLQIYVYYIVSVTRKMGNKQREREEQCTAK